MRKNKSCHFIEANFNLCYNLIDLITEYAKNREK